LVIYNFIRNNAHSCSAASKSCSWHLGFYLEFIMVHYMAYMRRACFFFNVSGDLDSCSWMCTKSFATIQQRSATYVVLRQANIPFENYGAACNLCKQTAITLPLYDNHAWRHIKWFRCVNPGCLNCSAWLNDGHRSKLADNHFNVNKTVPYSVHKSRLVIQGVRLLVVKLMFFCYVRARACVCVCVCVCVSR